METISLTVYVNEASDLGTVSLCHAPSDEHMGISDKYVKSVDLHLNLGNSGNPIFGVLNNEGSTWVLQLTKIS